MIKIDGKIPLDKGQMKRIYGGRRSECSADCGGKQGVISVSCPSNGVCSAADMVGVECLIYNTDGTQDLAFTLCGY